MLDFLKFQHEQQKRIKEKELEQQKRMNQLQLDIQKEWLEIQNQTEIKPQKLEEILLQIQQEQRNLLELTNRGQISENKIAFSQNTNWSAIDNFIYHLDEAITVASYFKRFEDLYATDCANWADS